MASGKTAIVFVDVDSVLYFIVDGNKTHLDDVSVNNSAEHLSEELDKLLYDGDGGGYVHEPCDQVTWLRTIQKSPQEIVFIITCFHD